MPLYEYQCGTCGRFEVIRKFSDPALTDCPTCGQAVHKVLSAPAIQFKGTGWYITDYARKSAGEAKGAEAGTSTSKEESKDTPKTTTSKEGPAGGSGPTK